MNFETAQAAARNCSIKKVFIKTPQNLKDTPVQESLFSKVKSTKLW